MEEDEAADFHIWIRVIWSFCRVGYVGMNSIIISSTQSLRLLRSICISIVAAYTIDGLFILSISMFR